MSGVLPVLIWCAVLRIFCNFVMFVVDAIDEYCSFYGLVYVESKISFLSSLCRKEDFDHGYSFGCFGPTVLNMFVVSEFRIKGETQYFGMCVMFVNVSVKFRVVDDVVDQCPFVIICL